MNASSSTRRHPIIDCASSTSSLAAEGIANNADLLAEILVCLPATSLIRFKSVSKHWLSLISESRFAFRHTARNPRPSPSALFLRRNSLVAEPVCVSLQGHRYTPTVAFLDGAFGAVQSLPEILHSCYGLQLWLYRYRTSTCGWKTIYIVCNPTTRSYKLLPSRDLAYSSRGFLAFDPSKSPHHKVVFVGRYPSVQIDVYSSESSSWRRFRPPYTTDFEKEVLCGSVVHWISSERSVIVGFDIDSEKTLELPNPPAMERTKLFGECGGRLTLIESNTTVAFRILEMDKDHWCWIVKFQVNLRPLLSVFPELERTISNSWILCVVNGENEKDFGLVLLIPGRVVYYNLNSGTWNVLHDDRLYDISPYNSCPFFASLAPL